MTTPTEQVTFFVAVNKETMQPVAVASTLDDVPKKGNWLLCVEFNLMDFFDSAIDGDDDD